MHLFEQIKEQLAVANCKRCERSDVQVHGQKLWCSWCGKECDVTLRNVEVVSKEKFESLHVADSGQVVDLKRVKAQPLRISGGWKVTMRNHLFELDPTPELVKDDILFDQTMLVMKHEQRNFLLDVGWINETNYEESGYRMTLYENDWSGDVVRSFMTKDRAELVEQIETLLQQVSNGVEFKRKKAR